MKIKETIGINNAKLIQGDIETELNNFSYDTRTIKTGDTFLGINGESVNGSIFYEEAIKKGAKTCVLCQIDIDKEILNKYKEVNIILVDDTLKYIIALAKKKRETLSIPIIAVTGSVGKTSTRNIIASVLESKYKVLKTSRNLNTNIGLAITLLSITDEEIAVLEMGMNHLGEISELTNIAKPDVAVITNVGTAHIGNLGSRDNILKAKLEIIEGLSGPLIINNDNDLLHAWSKESKINNQIITIGIDNLSDYQANSISYNKNGSNFNISSNNITINVIGKHFIYNSLIAFAIGDIYQINHEDIIKKLKNIPLEKSRMELGDILELGEFSKEIHTNIGKLITKNNIDILITVGDAAKLINDAAISDGFNKSSSYHFKSNNEVIEFINNIKEPNDTILIKASHGMNFIEIVNGIKE